VSLSINYHREGDGPPLVLLHGVGHHWQAWAPVIERLVGKFDVIACDSPGFGRSATLSTGIEPTIPAYADAFEWFFAELGVERPHVAGNSMGGAIALELARGRAVRSVTAFSPAGFWTTAELRFCQLSLGSVGAVPKAARPALEALARSRAGRVALFSQTYGYPTRLPAEEAVATLRDVWASPALSGALDAFSQYRFGSPEQLRSTPVTIAWGRRDRLLPYRLQAPRARAMLPWATHVTLGAGHVPFFDDPAAVAEVIRARARSGAETAAQRP
jgi:pimeloyl-ACP methyl ester carboxylesterase